MATFPQGERFEVVEFGPFENPRDVQFEIVGQLDGDIYATCYRKDRADLIAGLLNKRTEQ